MKNYHKVLAIGAALTLAYGFGQHNKPAPKPVEQVTEVATEKPPENIVKACGCADGMACICGTNCVCDPPMKAGKPVATTAPLAPNGLPYPYRWAPPGPRPTTVFANYKWMPDAQGSDTQGWWLMPNGQPAVQPIYQQSSCGPGGCAPRGVFRRR